MNTATTPTWLQGMTRSHLRIRGFEAGSTLLQEGAANRLVFILIEGRVKSCAIDLEGREVVFASHGPGEALGDLAFNGEPSLGALQATERGRCAVYTQMELEMALALYPELQAYLLLQSQRLVRALQVQVTRMALMSVQQRVFALLQDLAAPGLPEQARGLREQLTQSDIAARVGCTREMVGRALAHLADEGLIARRDRQIVVLPARLPARPPRVLQLRTQAALAA